jgi:hypothetical protein
MSLYYKLEIPLVNNDPVLSLEFSPSLNYTTIDIPFYQRDVFLSPITNDPDWEIFLNTLTDEPIDNVEFVTFHFKLARIVKEYCIWQGIELPPNYYQIFKDSLVLFIKMLALQLTGNEEDNELIQQFTSNQLEYNQYHMYSNGFLIQVNDDVTAAQIYENMTYETYLSYFLNSNEWDVPGDNGLVELPSVPENL